MAIRFVIDSASDILPEEAGALGMIHIPMRVRFDDREYLDAVDLRQREFYEKLIECDTLPVTSQIVPFEFEETFQKLVDAGDEVICVTMSSVLSGTYASACVAAENFPGKVHVVDSRSATIGERLLILHGVELVKEGKSAEEVAAILTAERDEVRILAVLDTLEYLKRGGRISSTVAFAGTLLAVKPAITVRNGAVEICGKARGSKNVNNLLRKMIEEGPGIDFRRPYCVAYTGLDDSILEKYIEDSRDLWADATGTLPKVCVGSVIGTHIGPGGVGVAFFEKKK